MMGFNRNRSQVSTSKAFLVRCRRLLDHLLIYKLLVFVTVEVHKIEPVVEQQSDHSAGHASKITIFSCHILLLLVVFNCALR